MKDAEFKAEKRRIKRYVDRWHDWLGLRWWVVHYDYYDVEARFQSIEDNEIASTAIAQTIVQWEYLTASIAFNLVATKAYEDEDDIEYYVVHEMCHILVAEMRADRSGSPTHENVAHEERVVSQLARTMIVVREQGEREGRKAK